MLLFHQIKPHFNPWTGSLIYTLTHVCRKCCVWSYCMTECVCVCVSPSAVHIPGTWQQKLNIAPAARLHRGITLPRSFSASYKHGFLSCSSLPLLLLLFFPFTSSLFATLTPVSLLYSRCHPSTALVFGWISTAWWSLVCVFSCKEMMSCTKKPKYIKYKTWITI